MRQAKLPVSGTMITARALSIAEKHAKPMFKASEGWLRGFKERHGLKRVKLHGEATDADVASSEKDMEALKKKLTEYDLDHIYNIDETGLFYRMLPNFTFTVQWESDVREEKKKKNE